MDKPSTSKTENSDPKQRKKSTDTLSDSSQTDKSSNVLPLHRRRFDAKQKEFPSDLATLPHTNPKKRSYDTKQFCQELTERLQNSEPIELKPLYERSTSLASSILATDETFDHLEKLYKLMDQLFILKDQNSKMQRRVRDIEYLKNLQDMHKQIEREILKAKSSDCSTLFESEATSMDLDEEYGYTEALLDSMLAAGRNASLKRAKWKNPSRSKFRQSIVGKQRSRSMGVDDLENYKIGDMEHSSHLEVPYKGRVRRGSEAKSGDDKAKISKWTRVKAAFKWEKAHTGVSGDVHSMSTFSSPSPASLPVSSSSIAVNTPASISPASSVDGLENEQQYSRSKTILLLFIFHDFLTIGLCVIV